MTEDSDNITKLIILVAGLSTIAFFAYLAYKDHSKIAVPRQLSTLNSRQTHLEKIEQKLIQLELKLDSLSTKQQQTQQPQPPQPERNIVSMGKFRQPSIISNMRNTNTKELFDMR